MADQSNDSESKTRWLDLTSRWLVCADKVEQMSGSLPSATEHTTPSGKRLIGLKLPPVAHLDAWSSLGAPSSASSANLFN